MLLDSAPLIATGHKPGDLLNPLPLELQKDKYSNYLTRKLGITLGEQQSLYY